MEQIQMVHVDVLRPHEQNPRIDAAQVEDLTESIREHGIEVALVAAPAADGDTFVVLAGHRRLTAAHALGLAEVPVQVRDDLTDPKTQLAFMATENILRDQLTAVEESRLVQDMLDLGMTQAQVAKQTALGKQRVKERVKLAKLAGDTGEKVHRGQITVDDALLIVEYSDDPDAVAELEATAGTYQFDYKVSEARRRREDRQRVAASRKEAKKRGLRLSETITRLSDLVREGAFLTDKIREHAADDTTTDEWTELLIAEHASCPGHSAIILEKSRWVTGYGHAEAGTIFVGCDQQETQHPTSGAATDDVEPEPEPEPADPWEDLDAEDFATAKTHRERHLAAVLPTLDVATEARDIAVQNVIEIGWGEYYDQENGIAFLQAITNTEGKDKVTKVLHDWPIGVLIWIAHHGDDLQSFHRMMARGHQGSTYWRPQNTLRQLLERTDYHWTPVEQQAILLATGTPHDVADGAEDGAALAEGGEAA